MKFIAGQKQEMSQVYGDDKVIPITIIKVGQCKVSQVKTTEKDGYEAVQVGFGRRKRINKPLSGHMKNEGFKNLKEFKADSSMFKVGDILDIESFEIGEKVNVCGTSKGKGFQGVVRRHGFAGQPKTHGTKDQVRMPGSIGATGPAHVFKGTKMAGQMGNQQSTVTNLEIIEIDTDNNLIKVKGAVPGHRNALVFVESKGEMKVVEVKKEEKPKKEVKDIKEGKKEDEGTEKKEVTKKEENKADEKVEKKEDKK